MRNFLTSITFDYLIIYFFILLILFIIVCILLILTMKKATSASQEIFSLKREFGQRIHVIQNTTSQMAKDLPLAQHPAVQEKELTLKLETAINQFSQRLSQKINDILRSEQNQWNEKFSILLQTMGKTDLELTSVRDQHLKESWNSISEISKKSQLLFHDMKEDGIFYRLQSLWLLSNLSYHQHRYLESYRHIIAGFKLYYESKPQLPISQKMIWELGDNLNECLHHIDLTEQRSVLKKFHISSHDIFKIFENINHTDPNTDVFRKIQYWNNTL